jgi:hypothetical protein
MLAGLALVLGLMSMAASIGIIVFFFAFYRPKAQQVMQDYGLTEHRLPVPAADGPKRGETPQQVPGYDPAYIQLLMTNAVGFGTALVAASVALLGIGTTVTLLLVILNRRVTLRQVNTSLEQISKQIASLQLAQNAGPPRAG